MQASILVIFKLIEHKTLYDPRVHSHNIPQCCATQYAQPEKQAEEPCTARVFLIPLIYSKVILNGDISTAQLLTLKFKVFLAKNFLKVNDHSSTLFQHPLNNNLTFNGHIDSIGFFSQTSPIQLSTLE